MDEPQRTTRDRDELQQRLTDWLRATVDDAGASISALSSPSGSGMSSETLLFDATWDDGAGPVAHPLVARVAPQAVDVPVFPSYDLALQFRVMQLVGEASAVPVPPVRWLELDT